MKVSEIFISILIFLLVCMCAGESFIYFSKNQKKINLLISESETVLSTDIKIRKNIRNIKIPYWKNAKNLMEKEREKLLSTDLNKEVKILSIEVNENKKDEISGLKVLWLYKGKVHETNEEFIFGKII